MSSTRSITPCLWFESEAEEAARFYAGIFRNSKITGITRFTEAGQDIHGKKPGSVMTVAFELDGQPFTALNGGPVFKFNEAVSFQVMCDTQEDVDRFWDRLSEGGDPPAQQCGWLKDKFGLSWQVVPGKLIKLLTSPDGEKARKTTEAMLKMKKLVIADLVRASES